MLDLSNRLYRGDLNRTSFWGHGSVSSHPPPPHGYAVEWYLIWIHWTICWSSEKAGEGSGAQKLAGPVYPPMSRLASFCYSHRRVSPYLLNSKPIMYARLLNSHSETEIVSKLHSCVQLEIYPTFGGSTETLDIIKSFKLNLTAPITVAKCDIFS